MKRVLLILFLSLWISSGFGQGSDHLVPVEGYYDSFLNSSILHTYHEQIKTTLFKGIENNNYLFRVLFLPSFQSEKLFSIEYQNGKLVLLKRTVPISIWAFVSPYSGASKKDIKSIKLIEQKIPINQDFAKELQSLYSLVLSGTKYPQVPNRGFDGESVYFFVPKEWEGVRSGKIWSPTKGTKMYELVEVSRNLEKLIEEYPGEKELEPLRHQYQELKKKFEE